MHTRVLGQALRTDRLRGFARVLIAVTLVFAVLPGGLVQPDAVRAAGGDYTFDLVGAAPLTYDHAVGGGAFNDRTVGRAKDIVESLEGADFACGDIVTYLTQITVDDLADGKNPSTVETIEIEYVFGAQATNAVSVGHIDIVNVEVNYGPVVNGAGPGGTDSGINDDGGSTATLISKEFTSGATPDGSYPDPSEDDLIAHVVVDDLESFETVVVRIDVLLGCGFEKQGTGNVQAGITAFCLIEIDGAPVTGKRREPVGRQTVPFKGLSNVTPGEPPTLTVIKSNDADDDGVFSDTETADGVPTTVTYQVQITNTSPDPVEITGVDDDIHDITGSSCATLIGTVLQPGETITCTFDVELTEDDATVVNIFTVDVVNDHGQASDADDSTVLVEDLLPAIVLEKSADVVEVPESGGDVTFTVTVVNESAESVTLTSLVDDVFGDLDGVGDCSVPQEIAVGGSYSCSFTEFVSGEPGSPHVNVVTGVASDDDGNEVSDDDDATVTFTNLAPAIEVSKTADVVEVPETGADVTYTIVVDNVGDADVVIDSIVDDVFGDVNGLGDCSVPQEIAVGGSYSCSFTEFVSGVPGEPHVNVVTVTGSDEDGEEVDDSDDETVDITDELPAIVLEKSADVVEVPESGGDVTFTVTVVNESAESVTLTSLVDDVFGDLDGVGDCSVPQEIAVGGSYSCSFTEFVSGEPGSPHVNVVTGVASDDDGNEVSDDDDATVTFTNLAPAIEVSKTADVVEVPETGADVTYTIVVDNVGDADVVIDSIVDDVFGDVNGLGDCSVPQEIAVGGSYSCSFTEFVSGVPGEPHVNVVTVTGSDEDGEEVDDSDDETVDITDELPAIVLEKSADVVEVPESGGDVTFTVTVVNESAESVTLTSLVDDVFGDLDGVGDCSVPQEIAVGGSYSCSFTEFVSGEPGSPHVNVVTGVASDDDGNEVSDDDDATVTFTNLAPAIEVSKTADVVEVPETGADVTYTIVVDNVGDADVVIDSIVDDVFGDVNGLGDCSVPQEIAVGGSYSCSFTEFVSGVPGEPHVNVVTVTGSDEDGEEVDDSDDETVDITPLIDLELTKIVDEVFVAPGDFATWTIVVTNQGPSDATGVVVTDVADPELTYVSHSGDGAFDQATMTWTIGDLAVGASVTLQIVTVVEEAGVFENAAEVTAADQPDIDSVPGDGQGDDYDDAFVDAAVVLASATIGDFVWHDEDKDGVQDPDEDGISGVTVRLTNLSTGAVTETVTNADGMYLFAALEEGQYRVSVVAPNNQMSLTTASTITVDLGDGESFLDADFGFAGALPRTGVSLDQIALAGLIMLLLGAALTRLARAREEQLGLG